MPDYRHEVEPDGSVNVTADGVMIGRITEMAPAEGPAWWVATLLDHSNLPDCSTRDEAIRQLIRWHSSTTP